MIELPPIGRNNSIHLNNRKKRGRTNRFSLVLSFEHQ